MAGITEIITPNQMTTPQTFRRTQATPVVDAIRSFTIGNQTTSTVVRAFIGTQNVGKSLYSVVPGQNLTFPIQPVSAMTFDFQPVGGAQFDGQVYIHLDDQSLSASGFIQNVNIPAYWDLSFWDQASWS